MIIIIVILREFDGVLAYQKVLSTKLQNCTLVMRFLINKITVLHLFKSNKFKI